MLSSLLYYLILKPLSLLPLPVLYVLADVIYLVIYGIGYRKEVVYTNLRNAFPDKSDDEIRKVAKGFYHYLADLMVEVFWCFSLTEHRIRKRLTVENPEVLDKFYEEGRSVVLILGHYGSWEMVLSSLNLFVKHQVATIYVPLTNEVLDKKFYKMRTTFGSEMIRKRDFSGVMKNINQQEKPRAIIFGADQSPSISKNIYWTSFLNQDTAVATGAEKYAKKYDMPVVFTWLKRTKRGHYNAYFEVVSDNPQAEATDVISSRHVKLMEKQIVQNPEYWLWSHKRWKKKRSDYA